MSKFNRNQKILVLENNELKKGTIQHVYESLSQATVKFDSGDIRKIELNRISIIDMKFEMKGSNLEIKRKLKESGVKQWELAEFLGIPEFSFSRKMRREFSLDFSQSVLNAIDIIAMSK